MASGGIKRRPAGSKKRRRQPSHSVKGGGGTARGDSGRMRLEQAAGVEDELTACGGKGGVYGMCGTATWGQRDEVRGMGVGQPFDSSMAMKVACWLDRRGGTLP